MGPFLSVLDVSVITVCDFETTTVSARIEARQASFKTSRVLFELAGFIVCWNSQRQIHSF